MGKKLGYIRTSTNKQLHDRQVNELQSYCDQVYIENAVSATGKKRHVYEQIMRDLNAGDSFVICAVDRAYRDTVDALTELAKLHQRGVKLVSLAQNFDTATPDGKFMFTLAVALASWERDILIDRTRQGMKKHSPVR